MLSKSVFPIIKNKLFQIKYAQHKLKKGIFFFKSTGINYPLKIIAGMKLFGKALKCSNL